MAALFTNLAMFKHNDLVSFLHRGQAVSDHQHGAAMHRLAQS